MLSLAWWLQNSPQPTLLWGCWRCRNVWSNLSNPAVTQSTAPQQLDAATFLVDLPGNIAAQGALSPSAAASRCAGHQVLHFPVNCSPSR